MGRGHALYYTKGYESCSEIQLLHVHVCSVVVQWPWLHACVKSTISASYTFCRTVAERFRQQWHDLDSPQDLGTRLVASTRCKPGSVDESCPSLSFNWMQTSLQAPKTHLLISLLSVLHKQVDLGITASQVPLLQS